MIELQREIVLIDHAQTSQHRYYINSGTSPTNLENTCGLIYKPGSLLPLTDWRLPTEHERSLIEADQEPEKAGNWLSIVTLPEDLLTPFLGVIELSRANTLQPIHELMSSSTVLSAINELGLILQGSTQHPDQQLDGGFIFASISGKPTVTYAPGPEYVGLHVDSFYPVPLEERRYTPNRICINLSSEPRYLVFMNIALESMFHILKQQAKPDPDYTLIGSPLGRAFMRTFPAYPLIKVAIYPGEAYIAPTEHIVHDGSSLDRQFLDVHLTYRGTFRSQLSL